jgi:hypothetical protein
MGRGYVMKGSICMRKCTTPLLVLALTVVAFAQDNGNQARTKQIVSKDGTREFTETFLKSLVTSRPLEAFALIKSVAPDFETDIETTRESTEQLIESVRPSFGRIVGYEPIDTKSLGKSLVQYDYLLKFERNALHCRMRFYKPATGAEGNWLPIGIWFDRDIEQLFIDLGK